MTGSFGAISSGKLRRRRSLAEAAKAAALFKLFERLQGFELV
jgi:hypothetical protein